MFSRLTQPHSSFPVGSRLGLMSCCALLMSLPAGAAEFVMRDFQALVTAQPTAFDFTLTTPTFTRTASDAFDSGTGLELGGRYSIGRVGDPFGLIIGLDATSAAYSYGSQDFMLNYGARGSLGLGYALNDDWAVSGECGMLYGKSRLSLPASNAAPAFTADGTYQGYDARLVCQYRATKQVCVSVQAGYVLTSYDMTTNANDTLTLDQQGPYIGLGLTWRFSSAPARVE